MASRAFRVGGILMEAKELPSQEYLKECLNYDQETGLLYWKERPLNHFPSKHICDSWNTKNSKKIAFTSTTKNGYKIGSISGKMYLAHRIIWKWYYGTEPNLILHYNGNKTDNRIKSLTSGTKTDNGRDTKISKRNNSGIIGVNWAKKEQKWHARIMVASVSITLGYFKDFFEACCARKSAERKYGFSENHGMRA